MSDTYDIWMKKIEQCHIPRWDELPDIDLYMDQVISQLDKYLDAVNSDEHILTASMVNNYVKQQLLPAPVKKRYSRVHMAYLIAICLLKQSLSMPEIKALLDAHIKPETLEAEYNSLCAMQEDALVQAVRGGEDASRLAVKAALLSGANKVFAQQLINIDKK